MEQHNNDIFDTVETLPTIEEIGKRLRKLGCTKEQVRRHMDQVAMSRTEAAQEKTQKTSHRKR